MLIIFTIVTSGHLVTIVQKFIKGNAFITVRSWYPVLSDNECKSVMHLTSQILDIMWRLHHVTKRSKWFPITI